MKKAQGISMNVIIIAALALLVLVVLSVVFIGKTGKWGADISKCQVNGGDCTSSADCVGTYKQINPAWTCEGQTVCCIDVGTGTDTVSDNTDSN